MLDPNDKLQHIFRISAELASVNDLDVLLEKILGIARQLLNADAGSIYVVEGKDLKFSYAQNDTLSKQLPPGKKLIYTTFSLPINNDTISGYVANTGKSLNIPDVYHLPSSVPYRFGKQYDEMTKYRTTSVLTVPLKTTMGKIVGVLQLINAKRPDGQVVPFSKDDELLATHFANSAAVAMERAQMTRAIILRMISMAELRDPSETGAHVNRVAGYAVEIYEQWAHTKKVPQQEVDRKRDVLRMAAMLHDVGKVAISDTILKKPGRFTPEEYEIMKTHSHYGRRLFINPSSEFDEIAADIALSHHENWDGSGYPGHIDMETGKPLPDREGPGGKPLGKKGEEIPVFARVVAVADVYDALVSKRCYKEARPEAEAIAIIDGDSGKKFDPDMVKAFHVALDMIRAIMARYSH
jgi:HD-GYP domain-containing protein (c-di-GMP phosphodiesterase class II)